MTHPTALRYAKRARRARRLSRRKALLSAFNEAIASMEDPGSAWHIVLDPARQPRMLHVGDPDGPIFSFASGSVVFSRGRQAFMLTDCDENRLAMASAKRFVSASTNLAKAVAESQEQEKTQHAERAIPSYGPPGQA